MLSLPTHSRMVKSQNHPPKASSIETPLGFSAHLDRDPMS